jgi:hypothetical protein
LRKLSAPAAALSLAAALFVGARGEFAVAIPLGVFGAGLLGWSPFGAQLGSAWGNYGPGAWKSNGQKSRYDPNL